MRTLLKGASVWRAGCFHRLDVALAGGVVAAVSPSILPQECDRVYELSRLFLFPGFVDVHVHLREPGFSYKETIASGTAAAAAGGYTAVRTMPNVEPAPDDLPHLEVQRVAIRRDAKVRVLPCGCITRGRAGLELADMGALAPYVAGFSDDGTGVQAGGLMEAAMREAKRLGKPIVAHCEDASLLSGGFVHDGAWARAHGYPGISSESEWKQVERDLRLVEKTGCPYHICHVSAKESVALIRDAKRSGLPVTCETAPHYLLLCDEDLEDDGRFKMNPPLRSRADRDALVEAARDGTLDAIATDHAPHGREEKARGLRGSAMGVSGLEAAFPVLYTGLVKTGLLPLPDLVRLLTASPAALLGIPSGLEPGLPADLTVFELDNPHVLDPSSWRSMGHSTPFAGMEVRARCVLTLVGGEPAYESLPVPSP